ncbi:ABC transporter ATP-binding protein [Amycolatopsis sp. PS_44_ISF1]|uniref:ABC transporter ATP-binding protein n=1 Tax=Amycolatopsis sp. PS_44_ISF1 TaxID=2974917 RepID=UPI0028DFA18E|nr:ABC transporter ATP-binding protein [Amycolatopsis sp. PS_44_ISF1]MDT8911907.1 ABC transporter ATP-binding protein [Amycolatopsis sp. PS_44_ISF1]
MSLLTLTEVGKSYRRTPALRPVSLDLEPGELVALAGPSGSGKSTLLMIAGGWETPDTGVVTPHPPLPDRPMAEQQWDHVGFVPQSIGLFEELSITDNLVFPARNRQDRTDVTKLLETLDLAKFAGRRPARISRGEQQRVAVARALVTAPALVLADEPTSHQDRAHAELVLTSLRAAADAGATVLVASHDPLLTQHADRTITLAGA